MKQQRWTVYVVLAVGLTVSAVFLWLAMRNTEFDVIVESLQRADYLYTAPIVASLVVFFWLKALRWSILLAPVGRLGPRTVMPATMVGYLGNLVLPAYLGEIVRLHILGRTARLSQTAVLGSLVLERVFDLLTILIIIAWSLMFSPGESEQLEKAGFAIALLAGIVLGIMLLFVFATKAVINTSSILLRMLPSRMRQWSVRQLEYAVQGLSSIRSPRLLSRAILVSIAQWAVMGVGTYASVLALGIGAPVSAAFIVMALAMAGMTLPNSPGFVGTIQLAFILGLGPYGIDDNAAFAASIYYHVIANGTILLLGLFYLKKTGETLFRHPRQTSAPG